MATPFRGWELNDAFVSALDFEEEQEEQSYEEEYRLEDEFVIRFSPSGKQKASTENERLLPVSKLLITTDDISAAFSDAYIANRDGVVEVAGLVSGPFAPSKLGNTVQQNSFWDKKCFFYSFTDQPGILICQMKQKIDQKYMTMWTSKVIDFVKPDQVIIFSSLRQCNVQMESPIEEPDFICQLKTDAFAGKTRFQSLPKPNLVRDIPAAVLSHCQVHAISAILYILVTEAHSFDVNAVKSFSSVLKEDIFLDINKVQENKVKEKLQEFCSMNVPNKGVYI